MKRLSVAVMVAAAFMLLPAAAIQAVSVPKATGSIVMSNPQQAFDFAVFETSPVKGSISYTNFEYADPGSGVWVPAATFDVGFGVDPDPAIVATYAFTVTAWQATSPTRVVFEGTGDGPDPWYGDFTGDINGSTFSFTLLETDGVDTFTLNASGTVDANGAVTGTWNDDYPSHVADSRTGTFTIADVGDEVFSFTTSPTCVRVNDAGTKAKFGYTIPAGAPAGLAGQPVAVKVVDGGSPGAVYDTYKHNFATAVGSCLPQGGVWYEYPITAGNMTVFT